MTKPQTNEVTRLCPNTRCQRRLTWKDEYRGRCPSCGCRLLHAAFNQAFVREEQTTNESE
jgi:hypothetical protein